MRIEPVCAKTGLFDTCATALPCGPDLWQVIEWKSGSPENRSRLPRNSGSAYRGSNPWGAAKSFAVVSKSVFFGSQVFLFFLELRYVERALSARECFPNAGSP